MPIGVQIPIQIRGLETEYFLTLTKGGNYTIQTGPDVQNSIKNGLGLLKDPSLHIVITEFAPDHEFKHPHHAGTMITSTSRAKAIFAIMKCLCSTYYPQLDPAIPKWQEV